MSIWPRRWIGWALEAALLAALVGVPGTAVTLAQASPTPTLPNLDHAVGFPTANPPRPLPRFFGFPVFLAKHVGDPLLFPNGSSIVYLQPQSEGSCVGNAEQCPPWPEIQHFPPGGPPKARFERPTWTYRITPSMDIAQPVWWDGAITLAGFDDAEADFRIVRVNTTGHELSSVTLPWPSSWPDYGGRPASIGVTPEGNGLLVYEGVLPDGAGAKLEQVLELLESDGSVRWERPIPSADNIPWDRGSVILEESGTGVEALSERNGRPLWRASMKPYFVVLGVSDGTIFFLRQSRSIAGPDTLTARSVSTGAVLWRRTLRYAWGRPPASLSGVFSDNGIVFCKNEAAIRPSDHAPSTCTRYADRTGTPQASIVVPDAPTGSVVTPVASSPTYLVVDVDKAPFKPPQGASPGFNCEGNASYCTPATTFSEPVAWSGKGPARAHSGAYDVGVTYDLGPHTAVTVTGPSSGWVWGSLPASMAAPHGR